MTAIEDTTTPDEIAGPDFDVDAIIWGAEASMAAGDLSETLRQRRCLRDRADLPEAIEKYMTLILEQVGQGWTTQMIGWLLNDLNMEVVSKQKGRARQLAMESEHFVPRFYERLREEGYGR
jgi:hypothetical protein